jgi:hypothetical protein
LKYKNCHGRQPIQPLRPGLPGSESPDVARLARAIQSEPPQPGRLVPSIVHQGYRFRAVGHRLYWEKPSRTLAEFLLDHIKRTVGKAWYMGQVGLPENQQHQIFRWFKSQAAHSKQVVGDERFREGDRWAAPATGDDLSLLSLGYDLVHLAHVNALPKKLVERLTTKRGFQGALHEIAVAATFVRAGLKVRFIEDENEKHAEFLATDPGFKVEISVEAKSRHRAGVLHEPGVIDEARALRGDVEGLVNEALTQADPARPFILAVDVNVPPVPGIPLHERTWTQDLWNAMQPMQEPRAEPDEYNAMFFLSYPFRWEGTAPATSPDVLSIMALKPRHPVPADVLARITRAMADYAKIPDEV